MDSTLDPFQACADDSEIFPKPEALKRTVLCGEPLLPGKGCLGLDSGTHPSTHPVCIDPNLLINASPGRG